MCYEMEAMCRKQSLHVYGKSHSTFCPIQKRKDEYTVQMQFFLLQVVTLGSVEYHAVLVL
jgi:hypothetical protein